MMKTQQLHELLLALGISRRYCGHDITVQAVQLILRDPDRLLCVRRGIYAPIAAQRQCDERAVGQNIRTVIRRAWQINRPLLEQLARYPLEREPTVSEFLNILAAYLGRLSE